MRQVFATFLRDHRELYIINLMDDNDFIKENIIGRREGWKKRTRHYIRITVSAVLFGALSAGTFAFLEPKVSRLFGHEEAETVRFETEPETPVTETETEPETSQIEPETSESEPETSELEPETSKEEPQTESESEPETVPIESLVRDEISNYEFTIQDYERMNSVLKKVASSADQSLVEVRSRLRGNDLFGQLVKAGKSAAGVVIAKTSGEILILTSDSIGKDSGEIEAVFNGDKSYSATIKEVDETDGIAVVSVSLDGLSYRDGQEIKKISLGDSTDLERGDMVVAVGAPAGVYCSSTVGSIAAIQNDSVCEDLYVKDIVADIDIDSSLGSFLLNTEGELVGWIDSAGKDSSKGYEHVAGISDYIDIIETISNGTRFSYLGLKAQEMTQEMSEAGLPEGLYIRESIQGSPAFEAGIQNGDVLVDINNIEIRKMSDYHAVLRALKSGDEVSVTVMRQNGAEYARVQFSVTVAGR